MSEEKAEEYLQKVFPSTERENMVTFYSEDSETGEFRELSSDELAIVGGGSCTVFAVCVTFVGAGAFVAVGAGVIAAVSLAVYAGAFAWTTAYAWTTVSGPDPLV